MTEFRPPWLTIMEHGSIGEARTKAFLIDRFWVLERSIDIDGADFLIQRRTLSHRFTDKLPPRLGVVQAKYLQDERTTHYIPKGYVLDETGTPLEGFFALLHVGKEDATSMYLMSSKQIKEALSLDKEGKQFIVGRKALSQNFEVTNRRRALDLIDQSLVKQNLHQVNTMLDYLKIPRRPIDEAAIDAEWNFPLPSGFIPRSFRRMKEELTSILFQLDDPLTGIDDILLSQDPSWALEEMISIRDAYFKPDGEMRVRAKTMMGWDDFARDLDDHKNWRVSLEKDGLIGSYATMADTVLAKLTRLSGELVQLPPNGALSVDLSFNAETFDIISLDARLIDISSNGVPADFVETERIRVVRQHSYLIDKRNTPLQNIVEGLWTDVMRHVLDSRYPD